MSPSHGVDPELVVDRMPGRRDVVEPTRPKALAQQRTRPAVRFPGPRAQASRGPPATRLPIRPGRRILLRQNVRSGLPKTRSELGYLPVVGLPNPRDRFRPAAVTM